MNQSSRRQVLLVQPLPVVALGLRFIIDLGTEMKVCADATTLAKARTLVTSHRPDLVIVDSSMENGEGFSFIKEVNLACSQVVVFSRSLNAAAVRRALQFGARAVISHSDSQKSVLSALCAVSEGRRHIAPSISDVLTNHLIQPFSQETERAESILSKRELQIYELLGRGLSVKEMAATLGISAKTVESNETRMKEKLGVKNNSALRHGATIYVSRSDGSLEAP